MFERYQVGSKLIAQMRFPDGVVALDIDAPDRSYRYPENRAIIVAGVRELAEGLSAKWKLGRFWMYQTGSPGLHVIFEQPTVYWRDILEVMSGLDGWHECDGHTEICLEDGSCCLRVGYKHNRPEWDIFPLKDNPTEDLPDHIVEHDGYLNRQISLLTAGPFVCLFEKFWPDKCCALCHERAVCPSKKEK